MQIVIDLGYDLLTNLGGTMAKAKAGDKLLVTLEQVNLNGGAESRLVLTGEVVITVPPVLDGLLEVGELRVQIPANRDVYQLIRSMILAAIPTESKDEWRYVVSLNEWHLRPLNYKGRL